ncbi:ABC transporter permease [Ensifer adhaerens]|uniref:ABC transporter permease n=1 Tax=Ensifer adhaerens TaxID=106592 RepID=UPI001CBAB207|nr:ABC transporter permease [Ensifer adhaerens]MBZ7924782.1 ABC transporter permease [Ensifer adhaerens]UAX95997.1 ABC transporter permease [Ensifer adhaerens]UAY04662.1 ABC transporter permease [Ensifer adhaerens]UAY10093.1 ABC transporter permease [Ensifer adhaerens]
MAIDVGKLDHRGQGALSALLRSRSLGVSVVLLVLIPVFALLTDRFLLPQNLVNIAGQSSILLLIALPMTLIILTEGIDLSPGSLLSLCGVVLALALVSGYSVPVATLFAVIVGLLFGILNGFCVAALAMPPFVVTLGSLGMAQGLALALTDGNAVSGLGPEIEAFAAIHVFGLPLLVFIAIGAYGIFHWLLYHTVFGRYVVAVGGNPEALRLSGVGVRLVKCAVYALSGATAGFAALCMIARTNAGHPTIALGMEFDAIAAVVLGGTSFERGNGWLFGTVLGVLAIGVLRNGMNLVGIDTSLQLVAIGVLVIAVLLVERLAGERSA